MMTALTVAMLFNAVCASSDSPSSVAPDVERMALPRTAHLLPGGLERAQPAEEGITFSKIAWRIGGVWAGIPTGLAAGVVAIGVPAAVIIKGISDGAGSVALGAVLAAGGLGIAVGAVLGYQLGGLAAGGRLWARVLLIVLDVVGLPLLMGGLVAMAVSAGGGG